MKHITRLMLVAAVMLVAACEQPATNANHEADDHDPEARRAEVQQLNDRWLELSNARDLDALVQLYASDVVVITPEGTLHGRDEVRAHFEDNPEGEGTLTTDRMVVADSGDLAYIFGSWDSGAGYSGDYLSVLARRGGEWQWIADAWNLETRPEE